MVGNELKKLSRRELVDIIYQMKKNEQQLQEEIEDLKKSLDEKRIRLSVAGSIAEAAEDITRIFSAAQLTADLYLNEISCMKAETEKECEKMIEEAKKKVLEILSEGEKKAIITKVWDEEENEELKQLRSEVQKLQEELKETCGG